MGFLMWKALGFLCLLLPLSQCGWNFQDQSRLVIGTVLPLSGTSYDGSNVLLGYRFFEEFTNLGGGVVVGDRRVPVELLVRDNAGDHDADKQLYRKLVEEDGVDVLLGGVATAVDVLSSTSLEFDMLAISCCTGIDTDFSSANTSMLFGTALDTKLKIFDFIATVASDGCATIALLCRMGQLYANACGDAAQFAMDKGLKVVFSHGYDSSATQEAFESILLEMIPTKPEVVLCVSHSQDATAIARAAAETKVLQGWDFSRGGLSPDYVDSQFLKYMFFTGGAPGHSFEEALGGYVAGMLAGRQFYHTIFHSDAFFNSSLHINALWASRFDYGRGQSMTDNAAMAVAAGVALRHAVENAGQLQRGAVRDAMRALDTETFFGQMRFNERQRNAGEQPVVVQWICGAGPSCDPAPVLPVQRSSAAIRPLPVACELGLIHSGAMTPCMACLEADAAVVRTMLQESEASGGSLLASCPVFATTLEVEVLLGEEERELWKAILTAEAAINSALSLLPNVRIRFSLAEGSMEEEAEGEEGHAHEEEEGADRQDDAREDESEDGESERGQHGGNGTAWGRKGGALLWTPKGAAAWPSLVKGWGVEWEEGQPPGRHVMLTAGNRTVDMAPQEALQGVGLAQLVYHMQWQRVLLVRCSRCGAMATSFRDTAAAVGVAVVREVELSGEVEGEDGARRALAANELQLEAATKLQLDDCEARVLVLLGDEELAEAVAGAVSQTGMPEEFVLVGSEATGRTQRPLNGMLVLQMSGQAAPVRELLLEHMWEEFHANLHADEPADEVESLFQAVGHRPDESEHAEHEHEAGSNAGEDAAHADEEGAHAHEEAEGELSDQDRQSHGQLLLMFDTVIVLGELFEMALRNLPEGGPAEALLQQLVMVEQFGLTGGIAFDEALQRTAGHFQVLNYDGEDALWHVISTWNAEDPTVVAHAESSVLNLDEWLQVAVTWPKGSRPADVCECEVWSRVRGDRSLLLDCRWSASALATVGVVLPLMLLALCCAARRMWKTRIKDEEEQAVDRTLWRLRKELRLTKDCGFVMTQDRRDLAPLFAKEYRLVPRKPLEALARLQLLRPFVPGDLDALCHFVATEGEEEGPRPLLKGHHNWRYSYICGAVLDVSRNLLNPADDDATPLPGTRPVAPWRRGSFAGPSRTSSWMSATWYVSGKWGASSHMDTARLLQTPQTQSERFDYFRDLVAHLEVWKDHENALFTDLKASVQGFMDKLHEGFNERFQSMLLEDGGRELAAFVWDPEAAGRGEQWWSELGSPVVSVTRARGSSCASSREGFLHDEPTASHAPHKAACEGARANGLNARELDMMERADPAHKGAADSDGIQEMAEPPSRRRPPLDLQLIQSEESVTVVARASSREDSGQPLQFFGADGGHLKRQLRQDHSRVRAIRVDEEDLMEAAMQHELYRSKLPQGPGEVGSAETKEMEEVFISQLHRRATLLNDGFQQAVSALVKDRVGAAQTPKLSAPAFRQTFKNLHRRSILSLLRGDSTVNTPEATPTGGARGRGSVRLSTLSQSGSGRHMSGEASPISVSVDPQPQAALSGSLTFGDARRAELNTSGSARRGLTGWLVERTPSVGRILRTGSLVSGGRKLSRTRSGATNSCVDDRRMGGMGWVAVVTAPVKTKERMREKLHEYASRPDAMLPLTAHILDPIRTTVCCEGPRDILTVLDWFLGPKDSEKGGDSWKLYVVKIKNKFAMEDVRDYDGYRDLMLNVLYTGSRGLKILGEIQIHDHTLHQLKAKMHKLYKVKRAETAATIG